MAKTKKKKTTKKTEPKAEVVEQPKEVIEGGPPKKRGRKVVKPKELPPPRVRLKEIDSVKVGGTLVNIRK